MTTAPQSPGKWSDLGPRAASAAVLAPLVLLDLYSGGVWAQWLFAVMAVLIAAEYVTIVHSDQVQQFALHAAAGVAAAMMPLSGFVVAPLAVIAVCTILSAAFAPNRQWWTISGVPYVALPAMALVLLREDPTMGWTAILWLAVIVWATDIGAYFAGRMIGGPKLAPRLSPKKTWAGLLGGMAAATAVSILLCRYTGLNPVTPAIIAAVLAVVAQAGDIYESALKRRYNLKDASTLIPGHGGLLDRVDGLLAAAVVAAFVGFVRNPESVAKGLLIW